MTKILVVDDEPQIREAIQRSLVARDYDVELAADGAIALDLAAASPPDLVVLDLNMPVLDGLEFCRRIRTWSSVPIIVLSVRDEEPDKIAALDLGADDYLTKPFGTGELLARVRALLRRGEGAQADRPARYQLDGVSIDMQAHRVTRSDGDVHLTKTEWSLLELLARRRGRLVSQDDLLVEVWGPGNERKSDHLRVHMAAIRRKLEQDPSRPRWLLTEPGMGYRFV